jgi:hypothetical protein
MKRWGSFTIMLLAVLSSPPLHAQTSPVIADAKSALISGDLAKAISLLTPIATNTTDPARQDAIEFLGLALERQGDFAKARVQYEQYIQLYPNAPSTPRVAERLKGVVASQEAAAQNRKWASVDNGSKPATPSPVLTNQPKPAQQQLKSTLKDRLHIPEPAPDPNLWTWEHSGDIAQFYYRSDLFVPKHQTAQSDIISTGDLSVSGENGYYRFTGRASGYDLTGLESGKNDVLASISTFYADIADKKSGSSLRVGRQSRNDAGIFGRFDGLDINLNSSPRLSMGFSAGSPVYSRNALPFDEGRYFASTSLTYAPKEIPLRGSIYAIEQRVKSVVDRRAIGAEVIYEKDKFDASAHVDYDVFYNKLNSAGLTGSWQVSDSWSINATLDYQTVPFLLTSNALLGQATDTLPSLVSILGNNEVIGLAKDRTAHAMIGTFGVNWQVNDAWQASFDAYLADYSGTKASGGVSAEPNQRPDIYIALTLSGASILLEGDQLTWGARYSDSASSTVYSGEASLRYPINDKLRLNTRLRISAKDIKKGNTLHWIVMPDFGLRYRVNKHWNLETDFGLRWENQPGADEFDLQAAIGYRYDF